MIHENLVDWSLLWIKYLAQFNLRLWFRTRTEVGSSSAHRSGREEQGTLRAEQ